jgi:jumonji domain-containing protein 7
VWSAVDLDPVTGEPIFGDDDALRYRRPRPEPCFDVEVRAGETLYIPAMWFHRVRQKGITIAVNSWFDMHFGDRYATRPLWEPSRRSMSSSSVTLA